MSSLLQDVSMYARFAFGMRRYFQQNLTLEDARRLVRERMAQRGDNFLKLMERAVYGHASSPYLALLRRAGCEFGDLTACVRKEGVESTLEQLRAAGVFVTFAQFKGRAPLDCDGARIAGDASAFDNPVLVRDFYSETGGSTGKATRISHDLDHQSATAAHHLLVRAAQGVLDAPFALWRGILPDGSGINNILHTAPFRRMPEKWFSHLGWRESKLSAQSVLFSYWFVLVGRGLGARIPMPRYVPLAHAEIVAQWLYDTVRARGSALLGTQVSRALRVALAAQERNLDLTGATIMVAGEPPTPAKVNAIRAAGARVFPTYGMAEVGRMAMGCAHPVDTNDTHFLRDSFALLTHEMPVPGYGVTIPAFYLTTLLPTTPKIMLNVIGDDYGQVEERSCGCLLDECGYTTHLREIKSVNKLTGEGITLVGTEMIHLLEHVLPARFGGSPLDYQIQEQEDAGGFTRVYLTISPRVPISDEAQVLRVFLEALSKSSQSAHAARAVWESAGTVQIRRAEPAWTARGKFLPLYSSPSTASRKEES